jgi:PAS domain S-box-containing protein
MVAQSFLLAVHLLTVVLSILFIYYCLQNRDRRGIVPLGVMFVGIAIWVVSEIIQMQTGPRPNAYGGMAIRLFGGQFVPISILLLGLDYTGRDEYITPQLLVGLAIVPILTIALTVSPYQSFLFGVENAPDTPWGWEIVQTPVWMAYVVYSYTVIAAGIGLLVHMMYRAEYGYRLQIFAIVLALFIPLLANSVFQIGVVDFDPTPVGYLATAVILLYAVSKLRLMDTIPVARETVLEEMDDMVFLLDEQGTITTCNDSVFERFGSEGVVIGKPIDEVLSDPILGDPESGDQTFELSLTIDGDRRSLNISKKILRDYRGNLMTQLLVCRDVTEYRRREEQIELLKDVQSRFLRHNLRNELNTILAHAEFMRNGDGPPADESFATIRETSEKLIEWGDEARTIERLVESAHRTEYDVNRGLKTALETVRDEYPDVRFESDLADEAWIMASPQIDRAFENLLENAAEYNTASDPYVRIRTEIDEGTVRIYIEDNGPGIDEGEIVAVEQEEETQLHHSSGFGLWVVYWVVDNSGGTVEFDTDEGTTVTLTFESVEPKLDV